ncbi:serine hydrolase [Sandarakinorhabdus cyanobacteriorum]|uniref:Serine hydrolase n=1 Tax=Sandarakinorhabdus cyanobacteriorum TaxID=1981098 RepID=A0A255YPK4_9SPHN|nr:serine hydrolase domain-containing protein [Sandarakinorhabdus cyanobacteriorum]OYQ31156.1 serine hydrolase [Sandarakinorhabdus cyanobacteriorum]
MLHRSIALALLLASPALAQTAPPPAANIAENPDVAAATRLFSAWMEGQIAYRGLPGVAVGVVHDQQLVWSKGFGFADVASKRPMTADTRFRIASNSKLFAAIAILQLREQGKLRLDDPVVKHLPWFTMKPAGPDDGPITIEQLLSHSSGMQREAGDHWSSFDFPTEAQLKALMQDRQAAFPPQTRWKYSNLAFAVAGLVVELVTGQRWADYVTANITRPLGMTATSIDKPDPGLATPYASRTPEGTRRILPFMDARGMASATGMTSTVNDLAKFISAQLRTSGPNVLTAGSWREALRVRSVDESWESGSGLGFDHSRFKGRTFVGHGGGYPGNTTMTRVQLNDKVGVVVLTNTNDSGPGDIANQLLATVGEAVAKAARPGKPPLWDDGWARFAGRYRSPYDDGVTQVVLLNRQLVLLAANGPAAETRVVLEPLGDGRFKLMAPTGGGPVGEVVRFEEAGGKVTRMFLGDGWSSRIDGW